MDNIEDMTIDFPCPTCSNEFQVSLYQLQDGGVVVCPWCQSTNVESELVGLENSLEFFDQALQNLKRSIERRSQSDQ